MMNLLQKTAISLIEWYQKHLSPDHSHLSKKLNLLPYCKFTPSCSEYMKDSIREHGFFPGILRGFWRVLRCNPWSKGGFDPVKPNPGKR